MENFWAFLPYFTIQKSLYFKASSDLGHDVFLIHGIIHDFCKKGYLYIIMHKYTWFVFIYIIVANFVPIFFIYHFPIFTNFLYKPCIQYTPIFYIFTHCKNHASRFCVFTQKNFTGFHKNAYIAK